MFKSLLLGICVACGISYWQSSLSRAPYRSVTSQSLHYFSRPHAGVHLEPLTGAGVWNASLPESAWMALLTTDDQAALQAAMAHWHAANKSSLAELTPADFPLGTALAGKVERWREQVSEHGTGLQVVRGVPLDSWTEAEAEVFFWALGAHLGTPGAQDNSGELLAHVRDIGADPRLERQYKTNAFIGFHCDAADVVGLLALRTGESWFCCRLARGRVTQH